MNFQFEVESREQFSAAFKWASELLAMGLPGGPMALYVDRPQRTPDQNDKYWPMMRDISRQVEWCGAKYNEYEWRDLFTALIKKQKLVPGIDGGLVVVGGGSSRMNREQFSDMIEAAYAFGTEHAVTWSEPSKKLILEQNREHA